MHVVCDGLTESLKGRSNTFECGDSSKFKDSEVIVNGNENSIELLGRSSFNKFTITVVGSNNTIRIEKGVSLVGNVLIRGDGNALLIKESTSFQNTSINIQEGTKVEIGKDCMFASGVQLRTTDSHSILDFDGNRINAAKDILIGDRCWVGAEVFILKGAVLANCTVVGLRSVVTGKFRKENTIIAGLPATIIREDVQWDRKLL